MLFRSYDQGRAGPGRDGIVLLWIQFARVVNPEVDWRTELWQPVVTRHSTIQNGKGKTKKQKEHRLRRRAHLDTATGARAVPARSTSLGRGGLENSRVFTPAKGLRTGTVRGPAVVVSSNSVAGATEEGSNLAASTRVETKTRFLQAIASQVGREVLFGRRARAGAQGEFKNRRKGRRRRADETEVFFAPKSASLRRRLPFLNTPCLAPWPPAHLGRRLR